MIVRLTPTVQVSHTSESLRETMLCGEKRIEANSVWTLSEYVTVQVNNTLL